MHEGQMTWGILALAGGLCSLTAASSCSTSPGSDGLVSGEDAGEGASSQPADDGGLDGSVGDARDGSRGGDAGVVVPPLPTPPSGTNYGATVLADGGVEFRVWAPNASGVSVEGDFTSQPIPLDEEDGGVFSGVVAAARGGRAYHYLVENGGQTLQRTDPHARDLNPNGDALIVDPRAYPWQSPAIKMAPKNASIIYELHVGSFGGDPTSASHGTFTSVAAKMPWLCALGVTAIELMPANEFGGDDGWGYNPDDYFAPHVSFGASSDLRGLVDAAHACGIGVMLDVVYNHYDGWSQAPLYCFDGYCPQGQNGVYFFSDPTYAGTPWGPRLDYSNPGVAGFVADGAFAWFSEYRMDGLRWDSTSNIRALDGSGTVPGGPDVLSRTNDAVHALRPDALLVAEDLKGDATVTAGTPAGGLGFDAQWDSFGSVDGAVTASNDASRNIDAITGTMTWSYNGDPFERVIYNESHDTVGNGGSRLPDQIDPNNPTSVYARKLQLVATTALLTAPGIPMLFMGEEMLATGTFDQTPANFDWSLAATNASIVAFYKDAIRLRRNLDGTSAGLLGPTVSVFHVDDNGKVMAYRRSDQAGHDVVVVLNFGAGAYASYTIGMPEAGTWHVRLNSDDRKYSSDFGGTPSTDVLAAANPYDGLPYSGSVALGSYAALVLSQ